MKEMIICCTPGHTHQNQAIMLISKRYSIIGFSCELVTNFAPFHGCSKASPRWFDYQFFIATNFAQVSQLKKLLLCFFLSKSIVPEDISNANLIIMLKIMPGQFSKRKLAE